MHSREPALTTPWRPLTLMTVTNPETLTALTTSHSPLPIRPYHALLVRDSNSEGELLIRLTFLSGWTFSRLWNPHIAEHTKPPN